MGTSFGFFVGRRKMRFFGSFVLLVAFAVVVVSVLSVEGAEPGWGLRTDYEFDNCTGAGPGVERYLKNNTCIPTGSSSSNLYRFLGTGVEIVGCVDSNCSTCNPALPVLYNACFQGAIYTAGVAETALNETIQRTAVNYQYATSTTQCNFENAVVIIKLGCYAPGAKGTYQQHQCTQDNVVEYRDCSPSGCSGCSGPFTGRINRLLRRPHLHRRWHRILLLCSHRRPLLALLFCLCPLRCSSCRRPHRLTAKPARSAKREASAKR